MPSGKDRLYLVLYARSAVVTMPDLEDTYQWALVTGPKVETDESRGRRFRARETLVWVGNPPVARPIWQYENLEVPMMANTVLLVRILIGKVKNMKRLHHIFDNTPIRPEIPEWNSMGWVKEALLSAVSDGKALGTSIVNWNTVKDMALWYAEYKRNARRYHGMVAQDPTKAATWDMLQNMETVN